MHGDEDNDICSYCLREAYLKTLKLGTEENDQCNLDACDGVMVYPPVENCSCHINPPCSACVANILTCDKCGRIVE